jgi:hypothetical protein
MTALVCFVIGLMLGVVIGWGCAVVFMAEDAIPVPQPPSIVAPPAPAPTPAPVPVRRHREIETVKLMDANERKCHAEMQIDRTARRSTLIHGGRKYLCARQDANNHWIYRQVPH